PEVIKDDNWLQTTFVETVQKRGAAVIKARGASSAASAANAVLDTVKGIIRPTAKGDCFSAAVCSNGEYGVDKGLIFGYPLISVGSANALEACGIAVRSIKSGVDPLDAVIAGIQTVEDDPNELTVGYGGLPNEEGIVELDAAVMHGPTHRAGAVASVRNVRHV